MTSSPSSINGSQKATSGGKMSSSSSSSHHLLDHHRKMSSLHQKRLEIVKKELSKSILIVQGLSCVVGYLTEQYDALNDSRHLQESKLDLMKEKIDRSDYQFKCQEQAMDTLKSEYLASELKLRDEARRIENELNDAQTRHENEKINLIASFQLEMDAARRQFETDLANIQQVKNELQKLNNQFREQLKIRDKEVSF